MLGRMQNSRTLKNLRKRDGYVQNAKTTTTPSKKLIVLIKRPWNNRNHKKNNASQLLENYWKKMENY